MNYEYPPYMYLEQVLNHCPKAAFLYWKLWRERDVLNNVKIPKDEIPELYGFTKRRFDYDIMLLMNEGLISNKMICDEEIILELVGWDQMDTEGDLLC